MAGYNEFSVNVISEDSAKYKNYSKEIENIVNSFGGDFDNVSIVSQGDNSKLVVRYMKTLSADKQTEINQAIVTKLSHDAYVPTITEHVSVNKVVKPADYIYTAAAILIVLLVATIFCGVRYNGASAIALVLACGLGTLGFLSIGAIARLTVGMSYFAMLVILNMLIMYFAIYLFEKIRRDGWLQVDDYSTAIKTAMKSERKHLITVSVLVYIVGLLFCLFGATPIKLVSINIMFIAVALLFAMLNVLPFAWSLFIPNTRKKKAKVSVDKK